MKKLFFMLLSTVLVTMCTATAFCADTPYISEVGWVYNKSAQVVVNCDNVPTYDDVVVELYNSHDELVSSSAINCSKMNMGGIWTDFRSDLHGTVNFSECIDDKDTYYFVAKAFGSQVKSDAMYFGKEVEIFYGFSVSYSDCFDDTIYVGLKEYAIPYYWQIEKSDLVEEEAVKYASSPYGIVGDPWIELHQFKPVKVGDVTLKAQLVKQVADSPLYAEVLLTYHIDENLNVTFVDYALKEYDKSWKHGDADNNGQVTSADAAIVIQKVLASDFKTPIEDKTDDYMSVLDVDCDGTLTSNDGAYIMQKALSDSYVLPVEVK